MLFINFLITCVCFWIVSKIYSCYLLPAKISESRFQLFSLRDQLAILAMKEDLSPKDEQYQILMGMLNSSIKFLDEFSIFTYLGFLTKQLKDSEFREKINKLINSLQQHKSEKLAKIASEYFQINRQILYKHTFVMRVTLIPVIKYVFIPPLGLLSKIITKKIPIKIMASMQCKAKLVNEIDCDLGSKLEQLKWAYS